jgi:hypothetical protein
MGPVLGPPIYVDEPQTWDERFPNYCHMWSSVMDVEALDEFAMKLGLNPSWLQHPKGSLTLGPDFIFWHYDISPYFRRQALQKGAVYKSLTEWIREFSKESGSEGKEPAGG